MCVPSRWFLAFLAGLVLLSPAAVWAQQADRVTLSLMVSHLSPAPGPIDPALQHVHEQLRKNFRYQSLRLLERQRVMLGMQEFAGLRLPTGKQFQVRPLHLGKDGVLVAIAVEGTLQTDVKMKKRTPVFLVTGPYGDGKLVVIVESE